MANAREWGLLDMLKLNAQTTTTQGSAVDLATYASDANREMKCAFVVSGLSAFATGSQVTVAVTECDTTNGTYTAPAGGTTSAVVTTNGVTDLSFIANKRYVRAEATYQVGVTSADLIAVGFALKREA